MIALGVYLDGHYNSGALIRSDRTQGIEWWEHTASSGQRQKKEEKKTIQYHWYCMFMFIQLLNKHAQ